MKKKKNSHKQKNRFTVDDLSAIFYQLVKISSEKMSVMFYWNQFEWQVKIFWEK